MTTRDSAWAVLRRASLWTVTLVDTQATLMFLAAGGLVVIASLLGIASGLPRRMAQAT